MSQVHVSVQLGKLAQRGVESYEVEVGTSAETQAQPAIVAETGHTLR